MEVKESTLNDYSRDLAARHYKFATSQVRCYYQKLNRYLSRDEMESECLNALVTVAARWESYCEERGFNKENEEYFKVYLCRRIAGAFADVGRANDFLRRGTRKKYEKELAEGKELSPLEMRTPLYLDSPQWDSITNAGADVESEACIGGLRDVVLKAWNSLPLKQQIALAAQEHNFCGYTAQPIERSKLGEQCVAATAIRDAVAAEMNVRAPRQERAWKADPRPFTLSQDFSDWLAERKESLDEFLSKYAEELSSDNNVLIRAIMKSHNQPRLNPRP